MVTAAESAERVWSMVILRQRFVLVLLVLSIVLSACAAAQPKAVQVAHIEGQIVEAASDTFAKMYLDDAISRDVYVRGRAAYKKWQDGQTALAKSLAEWKRIGDVDSKARLNAAISAVMRLADVYLRFIGQFVDVSKIKAQVEGGR